MPFRKSARRPRCASAATLVAAAVAALAGCERSGRGAETPSAPEARVVVRAFTDGASVRELAAARQFVFAATDVGVDRWNLDDGERVTLEIHGEVGAEVRALAVDASERWLWIAHGPHIGRYAVDGGGWVDLPSVPIDGIEEASVQLAAAGDDAVWLGGEFGLFRAELDGSWSSVDVGGEVTALEIDGSGALWIGTERGLLTLGSDGDVRRYDGEACALGSVRNLTRSLEGGILAVGDAEAGQRIAVVENGACHLFRASPDRRWIDVASAGGSLAVLTDRRLYATSDGARGARQLERDGMRLLALTGEGRAVASDYRLRSIEAGLPVGARALGLSGGEAFVGTDELGTARISLEPDDPIHWLRRRGILGAGTEGLTVECGAPDDCLIATGTRRLWRFDGERVREAATFDAPILAVVTSPRGEVYALSRGDLDTIEFHRAVGDAWMAIDDLVIELPGTEPSLSFARLSPTGMLWIGLRYRDDAGDVRFHGAALVDLALGVVAYHRATMDAAELERGVLPIPVNSIDVSFAGAETWLATSEGAAAVRDDGSVELYTEVDGLRSELLRGVAVNPGGMVFVATRAGVGVYDGHEWRFPRSLRYSVRALEFTEDGRLWMATDRGLAAYDGDRVRRLDARRGLLEDELRDLAVDRFGRVWVRGRESLTVLAP